MKKGLIFCGILFFLLTLSSCICNVKKVTMRYPYDSVETIITEQKMVKRIKNMILKQKFELYSISNIQDEYQLWNGKKIYVSFQNKYGYYLGKVSEYYVLPSGYVAYESDNISEEYLYISTDKIGYEWLCKYV